MPRHFSRKMLALFFVLSLVPAVLHPAPRKKLEDASLDFNFHGFMPRSSKIEIPASFGTGLSVYYERRLMPFMGIGLDAGFGMYLGSNDAATRSWFKSTSGMTTHWVDVQGRLYPVRPTRKGELYLQGGMGMQPARKMGNNWRGRFHGTAGVGFRKFLTGNKYLSLAVQYDTFSPRKYQLRNFGVKFGYGMRFGRLRTPGRFRKLTRSKAIALGILNPDGTISAMAIANRYKIRFAPSVKPPASQPKPPAPAAVQQAAAPQQSAASLFKAAAPAVVAAKPVAPAKPPAPATAKQVAAARQPEVSLPKSAAKPAVKTAAPKPAVVAVAVKPVAPVPAKPVPPAAKPVAPLAIDFGGSKPPPPAISLDLGGGKTAKQVVNIDLGGGKTVKSAPSGITAPVTYTWTSNDSLSALAESFYGDADLYPIIVDANMAKLGSPNNLKPGVRILVPRNADDTTKAKAGEKATQPLYLQWKKAGKQN